MEIVRTAKGQNILLPKKINHSTGKSSNCQTGFNDASWGKSTWAYVRGIDLNLSSKSFDVIIRHAMDFARKSRSAVDKTETSASGGNAAQALEVDKCALLKDRLCSNDEDYFGAVIPPPLCLACYFTYHMQKKKNPYFLDDLNPLAWLKFQNISTYSDYLSDFSSLILILATDLSDLSNLLTQLIWLFHHFN